MKQSFAIQGSLVDVHQQRIYPAVLQIDGERIVSITELSDNNFSSTQGPYILPGFIDAHVHIESSMLVPSEFARLATVHGTVSTISDPHEIANVCGLKGIEYMIDNGKKVPFKFNFGAPSCVPATAFETAGATIHAGDIEDLMQRTDILYLSEMMNFPGVLGNDEEVHKKINAAKKAGKPVDGHAPGLRGADAKKYIDAGISTDHECFTAEEALDKLSHGMKILIREGSAARNFEALVHLLHDHSDMMMFCSDDKHPDSLVEGHINQLCARAIARGIDLFKVLKAACINPVQHYKLKVGLIKPNDFADFILVKDLKNFEVLETYINGQLVATNGKSLVTSVKSSIINQFEATKKTPEQFLIPPAGITASTKAGYYEVPVIEALDGQLITNRLMVTMQGNENGIIDSSMEEDLLKIVVVNRYKDAPLALSFIKNFGLKKGALASTVAHDSHNIVAVGADDESICRAVNLLIQNKGGVSCIDGLKESVLPLPVAGLMSTEDCYVVAEKYAAIDRAARELGTSLSAPFMTLSFMALLVIPSLKLSDKGLFDGEQFRLI